MKKYYGEFENAYPMKSTECKKGEYRFLRTECGNSWYSVKTDPMKRDGCICPKCGRTVRVVIKKED